VVCSLTIPLSSILIYYASFSGNSIKLKNLSKLTFEEVWGSDKSHAVPFGSALGYMDSPKQILSGQTGVKFANSVDFLSGIYIMITGGESNAASSRQS
jgi:hypothetical protein